MQLTRTYLAVMIVLGSMAASARAQDFNDRIQGPRQQLAVGGVFVGDTLFRQPTRPISVSYNEPRKFANGSAVVESLSGTVLLPPGQHILKAQIVNSMQDPVGGEVLATLDYVLVAVTPQGAYYTLHLRGPIRVPDLNAFSLLVLRDATNGGERAEVSAMLSYVQPAAP